MINNLYDIIDISKSLVASEKRDKCRWQITGLLYSNHKADTKCVRHNDLGKLEQLEEISFVL